MDREELKRRTKKFAIDIINFLPSLKKCITSEVLGKQLVRSGTSVGANYRAACRARSKAEFISKISIVAEESDESVYWLELINEANLSDSPNLHSLLAEANELTAIFTSIGKSAKQNKSKIINHKSKIINPKS